MEPDDTSQSSRCQTWCTGFEVCPDEFCFCFALVFPCYSPVPLFWNKNVYFTPLDSEVGKVLILFYRGSQLSLFWLPEVILDFWMVLKPLKLPGTVVYTCVVNNHPLVQATGIWGFSYTLAEESSPVDLFTVCMPLWKVRRVRRPSLSAQSLSTTPAGCCSARNLCGHGEGLKS